MALRRRRFADLVRRQLDLFVADNAGLLRDVDAALEAYDTAGRDDAEEHYGAYVDLVDTAREELEELRDAYLLTLEDDAAGEYAATFSAGVRERLPHLALELDE
jgi:hypothetical protein